MIWYILDSMKYLTSLMLALLLFWSLPSFVLADESKSPSPVPSARTAPPIIKNIREKIASASNNFEDRRKKAMETLDTNLKKKVKDTNKSDAVRKIAEDFNKVNAKITEGFTKVVTKLQEVIKTLISRVDRREAAGYDMTATRTAITNATTAIDAARIAIDEQSKKVYTVSVTTEVNLKTDTVTARKQLEADLKIVREKITTAQKSVRDAAIAFAKAKRFNKSSEKPSEPTKTPAVSATPAP